MDEQDFYKNPPKGFYTKEENKEIPNLENLKELTPENLKAVSSIVKKMIIVSVLKLGVHIISIFFYALGVWKLFELLR